MVTLDDALNYVPEAVLKTAMQELVTLPSWVGGVGVSEVLVTEAKPAKPTKRHQPKCVGCGKFVGRIVYVEIFSPLVVRCIECYWRIWK